MSQKDQASAHIKLPHVNPLRNIRRRANQRVERQTPIKPDPTLHTNKEEHKVKKSTRQRIWHGVKKYTKKTLSVAFSHPVSTALVITGLALAVPTGGLSLGVAATFAGLQAARLGIDATKAIKKRRLNEENNAIVDYMVAAHKRKKLMNLSNDGMKQSIDNILPSHNISDKKSKTQDIKHSKALTLADRALATTSFALGIASFGFYAPTQGQTFANVAKHSHKIRNVKQVGQFAKDLFNAGYTALGDVGFVTSVESQLGILTTKGKTLENFKNTVVDFATKDNSTRQKLVQAINELRKHEDIGYDDIKDLRAQTRDLEIGNSAIEASMKSNSGKGFKADEFEKDLSSKYHRMSENIPEFKPRNTFNKVWQGIKDTMKIDTKYSPSGAVIIQDAPKNQSEIATYEQKKHIMDNYTLDQAIQKSQPLEISSKSQTIAGLDLAKSDMQSKTPQTTKKIIHKQLQQKAEAIENKMHHQMQKHYSTFDDTKATQQTKLKTKKHTPIRTTRTRSGR